MSAARQDPLAGARTVADLVTRWAERTPRRLAVADADERVSWAELNDQADAVAAALRDRGLQPGDRLVIQLSTGLPMVRVYLGAVRAGIVVVPVNPAYTPRELAVVLDDSGARALVAAEVGPEVVAESALLFAIGPGELTGAGGPAPAAERPAAGSPAPADPEAIAVLLYTSGTSGRPKGAMLSHRALLANIAQGSAITPPATSANDVIFLPIPLFHVYGLNAGLGMSLAHGSTLILNDRFDVTRTLRLIAEEGVTALLGAPAMFAAWAHVPYFAEQLAGIRFALSGSAPLAPEVLARYVDAGIALHEGYGLTEAAPVVTSNAVDRNGQSRIGRPKAGSVGAPLPGIELELRDAEGGLVDDDDPGLVTIRGANLFSGYWPNGTAGPDDDGWWSTEDLGYLDDDGDLVLVGRESDLVIVNGFNVYPAEVENVLAAHPDVGEVAVVGVPDATTGEALVAYVVARPGASVDVDALLADAGRSLARFKLPRTVAVVAELPHTVTGKVKKWQLRESGGPGSGQP
jgi:long-chain acyl-CoA synthetase